MRYVEISSILLQIISAVFAILAAKYWYKSSRVKILPEPINIAASPVDGYISVDTKPLNEMVSCLKEQAKVSKNAAILLRMWLSR